LIYVLYVLEVIVCLFLILVVLLQQGSGADLSVFGGGATQTAFGARGTTQFIHKITVWAFVAFILLTLGIAVLKGGGRSGSVMSGVDAEEEAPATEQTPAAPVAPPAAAPAAPATPEAAPVGEAPADAAASTPGDAAAAAPAADPAAPAAEPAATAPQAP
jgi:preprotein translocase subunit SecG